MERTGNKVSSEMVKVKSRRAYGPIVLGAAVAAALVLGGPALGQSVRILGDHDSWSAYATGAGASQICFAMARPTSTEPVPEGFTGAYLYITHRPAENVREELNLVAGYRFAPDSQASLSTGGQSFPLYTRQDSAWLADPAQATTAAQAIRAGSTMTVEGVSERGVRIRQSFSLMGATAASRAIDAECS